MAARQSFRLCRSLFRSRTAAFTPTATIARPQGNIPPQQSIGISQLSSLLINKEMTDKQVRAFVVTFKTETACTG